MRCSLFVNANKPKNKRYRQSLDRALLAFKSIIMKNFLVQFEYEGTLYECFVHKITQTGKPCIYIVDLGDSLLINKFNTKRLALCYDETYLARPDNTGTSLAIFNQQVLSAIRSRDNSPAKARYH
jgi:hypothetical protein